MVQPFVSVVIPAYNAARHLRGCLESVLVQDYPAYEVVVVDDASTDETRAVLREFLRVKVVEQPENRGPGAARNQGVGASGGDLIVFLDSDCLVEDAAWLGRHVRAHRDLADTIVGGGIIGQGEGLVARADAYCHWLTNIPHGSPSVCSPSSPPRRVRFSRHLVTTNMSLRRADFLRIGAFDTALRTGEDTEFCERALALGFSLRLEPAITVVHHDRERLGDFLRCFYRVGKDRVPARTRHRSPYHRLMPRGVLSSLLLCVPLAVRGPIQPLVAWWPHDRRVVLSLPLISLSSAAMGAGMVSYWMGRRRRRASS